MLETIFSRNIQYFYKVAQVRSISKTAELMHVSQSTVSLGIKLLEEDLSKKLFIRSKGKGPLNLTKKGEELFLMLEKQTDVMKAYSIDHEAKEDPLKIASVPYFSRKYLMPKLKKLEEFHSYQVFHVTDIKKLIKANEEGNVDIVFLSSKVRPSRNKKLCFEIRKEEVGIVGLKSKFKSIENIKNKNELSKYPLIVGNNPNRDDWFDSLESNNGKLWVDNFFSARSLILDGYGVGPMQLDYFSEKELKKLSISKVPIPSTGIKLYGVISKGISEEKRVVLTRLIKSLIV